MSYPPAKGEPILIPCEGSLADPNAQRALLGGEIVGSCAMCGAEALLTEKLGLMPEHTRDDVLARLERGDFG